MVVVKEEEEVAVAVAARHPLEGVEGVPPRRELAVRLPQVEIEGYRLRPQVGDVRHHRRE